MALIHPEQLLTIPYFGRQCWFYHHTQRERVLATQSERLRRLLGHAFTHNRFYRRHFEAAGIRPDDVRTPADLRRLPIVRRAALRQAYADLLSDGYRRQRLIQWQTSGSSGTPFTFVKDRNAPAIIAGFYLFFRRLWQVETSLFHGGKQLSILVTHDSDRVRPARRLFLSNSYYLDALFPPEHLAGELLRLRPVYLVTYPSTAKDIARVCSPSGQDLSFLTHIKTGGELLDRDTASYLRQVFPRARVLDTYSSNDVGFIGYQCREGASLHIPEHNLIVEIVDDGGQPVADGTAGEIVVTDLTNYSMPLIRYGGLSDLGRISPTPCPCGSSLRILSELAGRSGAYVALPDGQRLHAFRLTTAFESVPGMFRYQIVQERQDLLRFLVIPDAGADHGRLSAEIQSRASALLPPEVRLVVELVDQVEKPAGYRKAPVVLSKIAAGPGAVSPGRR
jgi:phenylacetate-CoA ligase